MKPLPPDKAKQAYQIVMLTLALFFAGRATLQWLSGENEWQVWLAQIVVTILVFAAGYAFALFAISKAYPRKGVPPREP